MRLVLHVWRQAGPESAGGFVRYAVADASPDISFLELLDLVNETLASRSCLLYTSPSPRDRQKSRMPSSA